jgi:hypothetical protein
VRRPEDPAGDNPATYDFSGRGGGHAVAAELASDEPAPYAACNLPDALAYACNWEGLHPFAYHEEDWAVAEEEDSPYAVQVTPEYADLATDQYLAAPPPAFLDVDHRYGDEVPVYENEAVFAMLADGSIVLRCGWGAEVRMTGGGIELHAAGDLVLSAGRSIVLRAGDDVAVGAHNSVDVTAAHGDVRTKAQGNSHHLAGNGGCGGFLFEDKSTCPAFDRVGKAGEAVRTSGFTVISQAAAFTVLARDAAVTLVDPQPASRIVLDAGGTNPIMTRSAGVTHRVLDGRSVVHLFTDEDAGSFGVNGVNEFAPTYTLLGGDLTVTGSAFATECVTAGGWVIAGQHVASVDAATYSGLVATAADAGTTAETEAADRVAHLVDTYMVGFDDQDLVPPGVDAAEFTCRTVLQYHTTDWSFWRPHWQTAVALTEQDLPTWVEPPVEGWSSGTITYPFPGTRLTEAGSVKWVTPRLVDPALDWAAVSRTDDRALYEAAAGQAVTDGNVEDDSFVVLPPVDE